MTKQKQIEEMATIIYDELDECMRIRGFDSCAFCRCRNEDKNCNIGHHIAKEVYDLVCKNEKALAKEVLNELFKEALNNKYGMVDFRQIKAQAKRNGIEVGNG